LDLKLRYLEIERQLGKYQDQEIIIPKRDQQVQLHHMDLGQVQDSMEVNQLKIRHLDQELIGYLQRFKMFQIIYYLEDHLTLNMYELITLFAIYFSSF
jgi:hypothetical protein